MKSFFIIGLVLLVTFPQVSAVVGVNVKQLYPASAYMCMKNQGYEFVFVRVYSSYGTVDHNALQNLKNAKSAGLNTHIEMFPCRGKNPQAQVDEIFAAINSSLFEEVWIDVITNPSPGCSWNGYDADSNCQFLTDIGNAIKAKGKLPGTYSTKYMWQSIFGSFTGCSAVASSNKLWYAHYDGVPSFSDFQAFGGWSKCNLKQYQGGMTECGATVDVNFYPRG